MIFLMPVVGQISQLQTEKYKMVQSEEKYSATYVQSIRDAALLRRISENKEQVERIVGGLTSTQRARFVFQAPPSTFLQFEQLALMDRNVTYADQRGKDRSTTLTVNAVESHTKA
jgi:hypothetical protein